MFVGWANSSKCNVYFNRNSTKHAQAGATCMSILLLITWYKFGFDCIIIWCLCREVNCTFWKWIVVFQTNPNGDRWLARIHQSATMYEKRTCRQHRKSGYRTEILKTCFTAVVTSILGLIMKPCFGYYCLRIHVVSSVHSNTERRHSNNEWRHSNSKWRHSNSEYHHTETSNDVTANKCKACTITCM